MSKIRVLPGIIVLQLTRKEAGEVIASLGRQLADDNVGSNELGFVYLIDEDGTEKKAYFNVILDQNERKPTDA